MCNVFVDRRVFDFYVYESFLYITKTFKYLNNYSIINMALNSFYNFNHMHKALVYYEIKD